MENFKPGMREVPFERQDLELQAKKLKINLPKNLGDILYTFRYRGKLPDSVLKTAPEGEHWIIRGAGRSRYCFTLTRETVVVPNELLMETKVPDATPGIIEMYAMDDEQALLAKLRYNRLLDIFTGITCYSLQSHLRTQVKQVGQVETDEIYMGLDRKGIHYVLPVQAKGKRDRLHIVQIEQDFAMCEANDKFKALVCRPIGAQFMRNNVIALFEFAKTDAGVVVSLEKHYRLVPPDQLSVKELKAYHSTGG